MTETEFKIFQEIRDHLKSIDTGIGCLTPFIILSCVMIVLIFLKVG